MPPQVLAGVRIVEVAMFAPDAVGMHLADLGAEVIKVEAPGIGDPARQLGKPYRGESPATRRWNRGKRSLTLDLRAAAGADVFRDLIQSSDAVVEGMRPGSLARRGLGYEDLLALNPCLVFATISGWGQSGPYRDLGSHGLAFDSFAGLAPPRQVDGRAARPKGHVWQGLEAAPLYAALAIVSAIVRARASGMPSLIEVSQADAAATWNGWRIAHAAAVAEHGRAPSDPDARELVEALESSAEGAGHSDLPGSDVRYQYYEAQDGSVLLMATETKFWENFCRGVDRMDLFERWPGRRHADHDYGNDALRDELTNLFATRTRAEWLVFFIEHDVAGAPVYRAGETFGDPHFESRGLWLDPRVHGVSLLGSPVRVDAEIAVSDRAAPSNGADSDAVLRDVLGYDEPRIAALRSSGAVGGAQ
ncbi:MAG: CoA transferase [Deltaproteobacteria bacterium]|nr:CoA transferase [Deltaproteobacteria bacterium]MBW2359962.1 CoA transferase [Deltaproteobacteria bacterium]